MKILKIEGFIEIEKDEYDGLENNGDYELLKVEHLKRNSPSPHIKFYRRDEDD